MFKNKLIIVGFAGILALLLGVLISFLQRRVKEEVKVDPEALSKQEEAVATVSDSLSKQSFVGAWNRGVFLEESFSKEEIDVLNEDSYSLTVDNFDYADLGTVFEMKSVVEKGADTLTFETFMSPSEFLRSYAKLLNDSLPPAWRESGKFAFEIKLSGGHNVGMDAPGTVPQYKYLSYGIFLNENLVLLTSGSGEVAVWSPVVAGKPNIITIPDLYPRRTEPQLQRKFDVSVVRLRPIVPEDSSYYSNADRVLLDLKASYFAVNKNSATKIYVFYPKGGYLIPFLAKKATVRLPDGYVGNFYLAGF